MAGAYYEEHIVKRKRITEYLNLPELQGLPEERIPFVVEYLKDLDPRRAAEACGYENPDYGFTIRKEPAVARAIEFQLKRRVTEAGIDAQWVLEEAVDNHFLARQAGDLRTSNAALQLIGKIASVDAFAADKVVVVDNEDMKERLERGRRRVAEATAAKTGRSFI